MLSQVRAIISAALELVAEGLDIVPRIVIPMLCTSHELDAIVTLIDQVALQVRVQCSIYYLFFYTMLCCWQQCHMLPSHRL